MAIPCGVSDGGGASTHCHHSRFVAHGFMAHGLWLTVCGSRFVAHGLWLTGCGSSIGEVLSGQVPVLLEEPGLGEQLYWRGLEVGCGTLGFALADQADAHADQAREQGWGGNGCDVTRKTGFVG